MLPDILRRIVVAKYVLQRASKMQDEGNEVSLSISLLLMHDAVEMLMIAVLDHLKISVRPKREFTNFWSEIKQAGHPEVPDSVAMQSLNKLRLDSSIMVILQTRNRSENSCHGPLAFLRMFCASIARFHMMKFRLSIWCPIKRCAKFSEHRERSSCLGRLLIP